MRRCSRCRERKPAELFSRDAQSRDGLKGWCKACCSETSRRRWQENSKQAAKWNRDSKIRRKYGLEPSDYEAMLSQQGGRCAICKSAPKVNRLSVDHDHKTGRIRGLLCSPCNRGIGIFSDDPERLTRAADYLNGDASSQTTPSR